LGKLKTLSGSDVCKILSKHGFLKIRQRGSHILMQKKLTKEDSTITIPVPAHKELKIGTLSSIIRQSGISRSEFE